MEEAGIRQGQQPVLPKGRDNALCRGKSERGIITDKEETAGSKDARLIQMAYGAYL